MGCDIGRIVPRWLLSTFNFLILVNINIKYTVSFFCCHVKWRFDCTFKWILETLKQLSTLKTTKQLFSFSNWRPRSFQMFTFLLLLVAVLLVTVPQYMRDLVLYIISRDRLEISLETREAIGHNLGPGLLSQLGWAALSLALVFLAPAFIGYVGAVRESRLCLILVRRLLWIIRGGLTIDGKYLYWNVGF